MSRARVTQPVTTRLGRTACASWAGFVSHAVYRGAVTTPRRSHADDRSTAGTRRAKPVRRVRRRPLLRRIVLVLTGLGLAVVVFLAAFIGGLLEAPFPSDASAPASGVAYLLDAHGHLYAQIEPAEARVPLANYSDIGQTMVDAIVAAEDERYFSHGGVDPLAILRAAESDLTGGDPSGASTITQQYVKNVYTNRQRTLLRKVKEAALAVRLDRAKSKQEILRLYLNSVYFGNNTYGVEAAAEFYFKVHTKQLNCGQAAMLAGLVSAPSAHEPVHHFADAKIRQHYVLDREVALKTLTPEQATQCYDSITPKSIIGKTAASSPTSYPEYADLVTDQVKALGPDLMQSGNVLVKTPLDEDLQDAAKEALGTVLKTAGDPEAVVVGINPKTGDVTTVATQGEPAKDGKSAGYHRGDLDIATQQYPVSGSTVKPVTLAAALTSGKYTLNSGMYGPPEETYKAPGCADGFDVKNAESDEGGYFSLRNALAQSVNTIYAPLAINVGLSKVKAMGTAMGIPTAFDLPKTTNNPTGFDYGFDGAPGTTCPVYPSQSLGVSVSPLDLDTAYSTIEDGGTYRPQRLITQVQVGASGPKANDGTVISIPSLAPSKRAMSQTVATNVMSAMRDVVTDGTAQPTLGNLPFELTDLIGKTGTTEGENNAWFVGCRPTLCLAVWMGNDRPYETDAKGNTVLGSDGKPIPNTLNGTEGVTPVFGGTLPARIFATTYADYEQNLKTSGQPALTPGVLSSPGELGTQAPVAPPAFEPRPTVTSSRKAKSTSSPSPSVRRTSAPTATVKQTTVPVVTTAPPAVTIPPITAPPTPVAPATTAAAPTAASPTTAAATPTP